ncbi:MAG: AzlC family ABC transporter permease [Pseudomonadota bacterium]
MSTDGSDDAAAPASAAGWSRDFALGAWHMAPLMIGVVPFGLLLGALAAQKGFGPLDMIAMSALVFAGASQFVAVEIWADPVPWLAIVAATALINLRHVLMSAAVAPAMGRFGPVQAPLALFFLADEVWAMALRRAREGRLGPAYYAGLGLSLYLSWLFWTGLGTIAGGVIEDPARYGFDFAFTAVFLVLIAGLWRGRASVAPVTASALVALTAHAWLPGVWFILLGGIAGALAGAMTARDER